jgi:hypothetical protein
LLFCGAAALVAQDGPAPSERALLREALRSWFEVANPDPESWRVVPSSAPSYLVPGYGLMMPTPTYAPRVALFPDGGSGLGLRFNSGGQQNAPRVDSGQARPKLGLSHIQEVMEGFLVDYGDLLPGLGPDDHLTLVYGQGRNQQAPFWHQVEGQTEIVLLRPSSAQASDHHIQTSLRLSDLQALRSGEIDRQTLIDRIEVEVQDQADELPPRYRVLASLLQKGLDQIVQSLREERTEAPHQLRLTRKSSLGAQMLPAYGIVYRYQVARPLTWLVAQHGDEADEQPQPIDALIDEQAEALQQRVPELLVTYGRTLRDLPEEGALELIVELPGCDRCEAPAQLTFKVRSETLRRHDQGQTTVAEAVKEVEVHEEGQAKEKKPPHRLYFQRGLAPEATPALRLQPGGDAAAPKLRLDPPRTDPQEQR